MTRCVHDHSRCCKFSSSCVHRESKSGQCDASIKTTQPQPRRIIIRHDNTKLFIKILTDGYIMPTGDANSSGHLVPSNLGLAYVLHIETNPFPELVVIFPDYAIRPSLGTFSILHSFAIISGFTNFHSSIDRTFNLKLTF